MRFLASVTGRASRYPVVIEPGGLARIGALLGHGRSGGRVAVVSDPTVARLYAARVLRALARAGLKPALLILPGGERSKSLSVVGRLLCQFGSLGLARDDRVLALGGGVVSDVAGFAAATYGRGVAWIAVPTTLLAQADAAIGGKVGVNLPTGKNLVGAYHHPSLVLADTETLGTLGPRQYRAGLAEVVKMGIVHRPSILARIERLAARGRLYDPESIAPVIALSARAKTEIVSRDERDGGERRILNFGHTVGHALETEGGYRRYLHGEAVALGIAAELRLSVMEAGLDPVAAVELEELMARIGLDVQLGSRPGHRFWAALARDKKRGRSGIRVVLCPAVGEAKVFALSSLTPLKRALASLVRGSGRRP